MNEHHTRPPIYYAASMLEQYNIFSQEVEDILHKNEKYVIDFMVVFLLIKPEMITQAQKDSAFAASLTSLIFKLIVCCTDNKEAIQIVNKHGICAEKIIPLLKIMKKAGVQIVDQLCQKPEFTEQIAKMYIFLEYNAPQLLSEQSIQTFCSHAEHFDSILELCKIFLSKKKLDQNIFELICTKSMETTSYLVQSLNDSNAAKIAATSSLGCFAPASVHNEAVQGIAISKAIEGVLPKGYAVKSVKLKLENKSIYIEFNSPDAAGFFFKKCTNKAKPFHQIYEIGSPKVIIENLERIEDFTSILSQLKGYSEVQAESSYPRFQKR